LAIATAAAGSRKGFSTSSAGADKT
jgi:hypothetical protein